MKLRIVLPLVGAFIGGVASGEKELLGVIAGLTIGLLIALIQELDQRLKALENKDEPERGYTKSPGVSEPVAPAPAASGPAVESSPPPLDPPAQAPAPQPVTVDTPAINSAARVKAEPREPDWFDRAVAIAKDWLTTGNVPVKVGIVISFFGVTFLLRYTSGMFPIEIRLLGAAIAGIAMLVFGWRMREKKRVFGLSLQGGGIGVLYAVIFAAFRLYNLIPAGPAFLLLVVLTALAGLIAVLQNAKALAIFGIVGGFLAPVLISTGSGNHVALFSYYLVLNIAILGIAQFRAWRELNLLGFIFTFVIGSAWGYRSYRPELFNSTEPFLVAHFLLYQAVAVLFALRQPPNLKGLVDGTLVFGTPVIGFALQSALLRDSEFGLAISAAIVALFYSLLAVWLWKRHRRSLQLLTESYIALSIAFATIAIPLALDARWTAAAWALEGAALVWLGVRQNNLLSKLAGAALVFAAGVSAVEHGWRHDSGLPILNGNLLGAWLIAWSSFTASRFLHNQTTLPWQRGVGILLFVWGSLFWLGAGVLEIEDRAVSASEPQWLTVFFAISGLLCTVVAGWRQWSLARHATLLHLPLLAVALITYGFNARHPFAGWGLLAWIIAIAVQLKILWDYERHSKKLAAWGHGLSLGLIAVILTWEGAWQLDSAKLNEVWIQAGVAAIAFAIVGATLFAVGRLPWPVNRHREAFVISAGVILGCTYLFLAGVVANESGSPEPLAYIPLLNPFDVVTFIALVAGLRWLLVARKEMVWSDGDYFKIFASIYGFAAFAFTTMIVVRGVHHGFDTAWGDWSAVPVQASLSIYWGLLAVSAMVLGARRLSRPIWMLGAGLMALVVVKLILVDLQDNVARIVSFLAVGALLIAVGYFAPAPARREDTAEESSS